MKTRKYPQDPPTPPPCGVQNNSCKTTGSAQKEVLSCGGTGNDCFSPTFLQAESSEFHDKTLIEATKKIQRIIASIPPDPQGRKPSLVVSKFGILLAWVYHGNEPEGTYPVTMKSKDATVIKALKLKL